MYSALACLISARIIRRVRLLELGEPSVAPHANPDPEVRIEASPGDVMILEAGVMILAATGTSGIVGAQALQSFLPATFTLKLLLRTASTNAFHVSLLW
jgi:hypothetical protein